jgi:hypothetical protein
MATISASFFKSSMKRFEKSPNGTTIRERGAAKGCDPLFYYINLDGVRRKFVLRSFLPFIVGCTRNCALFPDFLCKGQF